MLIVTYKGRSVKRAARRFRDGRAFMCVWYADGGKELVDVDEYLRTRTRAYSGEKDNGNQNADSDGDGDGVGPLQAG